MQIITLITDFGVKDYYVALLKGHLLRAAAQSTIVDITHHVASYDIMEGAFFLRSIFNQYPKGTIHIVGVHTYYNKRSRFILVRHQGYYFIAPNNGVLSLALSHINLEEVYEIADQDILDLYEVIANAVKGITTHNSPDLIGKRTKHFERKLSLQAVVNGDQIRATILYIDHFGNVIVNLTKETFERVRSGRNFAIYYKAEEPIVKLSKKYNDVRMGDVCAFFNSIDMLEIAVHTGNAHRLLSLNKNETIQIDFF